MLGWTSFDFMTLIADFSWYEQTTRILEKILWLLLGYSCYTGRVALLWQESAPTSSMYSLHKILAVFQVFPVLVAPLDGRVYLDIIRGLLKPLLTLVP